MSTQTRREFVLTAMSVAGGLVVGCKTRSDGSGLRSGIDTLQDLFASRFPNAWIQVTKTGQVHYFLDRVEMGQGTMTSHAMIVAEELGVDPASVMVSAAPPAKQFVNPVFGIQFTGASNSMATSWNPLRLAAAATRDMLIEAGATQLDAPADECDCVKGTVTHRNTGRSVRFDEIAGAASELTPPAAPVPKGSGQYVTIGKPVRRLDSPQKVLGKAEFGIDVKMDGLLTAVVLRAPAHGGKLDSFDDAKAKTYFQQAGVQGHVLRLSSGASGGGAVAVVAPTFWHAKKAAEQVECKFSGGSAVGFDGDMSKHARDNNLETKPGASAVKEGNLQQALAEGDGVKKLEAAYAVGFAPHQTLEPMNCTAHFDGSQLTVWAPTQAPDAAQGLAQRIVNIPTDKVKVVTTLIGGGFGRRLHVDYVGEAVEITAQLKKPVKVIWTREDDMMHDVYRPGMHMAMKATVTTAGKLKGWQHKIIGPSVAQQLSKDALVAALPAIVSNGKLKFLGRVAEVALAQGPYADPFAVEGADSFPYEADAKAVDYVYADVGIPVGFWRSVGHSHNGFAVESFMDELAAAAGKDPYRFRLDLLAGKARHLNVLRRLGEISEWGNVPSGHAKGIASHACFGSYCAQVIEVSKQDDKIRIERIWCVVDCGYVVNPDIVRAQIEGAIIWGLSGAVRQRLTFQAGATAERNFNRCGILRINEVPQIVIDLVGDKEVGVPPSGIGEIAVPAAAPALANAVAKLTGQRMRSLPLPIQLAPVVRGGGVVDPPPPAGDTQAQQAGSVLKKHCGECHDYANSPADMVAKNKVRRGSPEDRAKSPIRRRIADGSMPPEENDNGQPLARLTAEELKKVEDWIMNNSPLP